MANLDKADIGNCCRGYLGIYVRETSLEIAPNFGTFDEHVAIDLP